MNHSPAPRRALEHLRPLAERWAAEAVTAAIGKQEFDLVEMASHVPSSLMIDYFGFPDEVKHEFVELIEQLLALLELSGEDLFLLCLVLYIGGTENIIAFLTNMLVHIAEHPELRAELIADPSKVPAAIEELQRQSSTATGLARTITRDTELGGVQLRKGERIMGLIPAANHDPNVFPNPEQFRLGRDNIQENVAFGYGAHRCIGVTLTRMEAEVCCCARSRPGAPVRSGLRRSPA